MPVAGSVFGQQPGLLPAGAHRTAMALGGKQRLSIGSTGMRVTAGWEVPEYELRWRFSRSSGPGGQSVNTTDSRVELGYDVARAASVPERLRSRVVDRLGPKLADGVLTVAASEHRSQLRNRQAALARLTALLQDAASPPAAARRPTRPSRRARERRLHAKQHRAGIKRLRGRPEE